jgi:hypothetical protein
MGRFSRDPELRMCRHATIGTVISELPNFGERLNVTLLPETFKFRASRDDVAAPVSMRAVTLTPYGSILHVPGRQQRAYRRPEDPRIKKYETDTTNRQTRQKIDNGIFVKNG